MRSITQAFSEDGLEVECGYVSVRGEEQSTSTRPSSNLKGLRKAPMQVQVVPIHIPWPSDQVPSKGPYSQPSDMRLWAWVLKDGGNWKEGGKVYMRPGSRDVSLPGVSDYVIMPHKMRELPVSLEPWRTEHDTMIISKRRFTDSSLSKLGVEIVSIKSSAKGEYCSDVEQWWAREVSNRRSTVKTSSWFSQEI